MKRRTKCIMTSLAVSLLMNAAFTAAFAEPRFVKLSPNESDSLNYEKSKIVDEAQSNHGVSGFTAQLIKNVGKYDFVCKVKYIDSNKTQFYKVEDFKADNLYDYSLYIDINDALVLSSTLSIGYFTGVENSAFLFPAGTTPTITGFKAGTSGKSASAHSDIHAIGSGYYDYNTSNKVIAYSRTAKKINYNGTSQYFVRISGDKGHQYNWISADELTLSEKELLSLPEEDADAVCFNEIKNGEWYEVPENKLVVLKNLDADYFLNRDFLRLEPGSVIFATRKSSTDLVTSMPEWGKVSAKGLKKVSFPFGYEKKANSQEKTSVCLSGTPNGKITVYSKPSVKSKAKGTLDTERGTKEKRGILFNLIGCSTEKQPVNGQSSKWFYVDVPVEGKDEFVRGWVFGAEFTE